MSLLPVLPSQDLTKTLICNSSKINFLLDKNFAHLFNRVEIQVAYYIPRFLSNYG
jgi:hypothetical protein